MNWVAAEQKVFVEDFHLLFTEITLISPFGWKINLHHFHLLETAAQIFNPFVIQRLPDIER